MGRSDDPSSSSEVEGLLLKDAFHFTNVQMLKDCVYRAKKNIRNFNRKEKNKLFQEIFCNSVDITSALPEVGIKSNMFGRKTIRSNSVMEHNSAATRVKNDFLAG